MSTTKSEVLISGGDLISFLFSDAELFSTDDVDVKGGLPATVVKMGGYL